MQKWEIKVINIRDTSEDHTAEIEQAGLDGWELVTVLIVPYPKNSGVCYFFKRPIVAQRGIYQLQFRHDGKVDSVVFVEPPVDSGIVLPMEKPDAE